MSARATRTAARRTPIVTVSRTLPVACKRAFRPYNAGIVRASLPLAVGRSSDTGALMALTVSPIAVAAYSLLFVILGAVFLAVNLIVGRFLRPKNPNEEKLSVYECGEPT